MGLSPTLWRTCRVLAGRTRLALFRRIIRMPGQAVSQLARAEKISLPRASQELRRLQARGVVGVERNGRFVLYYPEPDPLVASAKPILRAMQHSFSRLPPAEDERLTATAQGLAHPRRLEIVRALRERPAGSTDLVPRLQIPPASLAHHLAFLKAGGWIELAGEEWQVREPATPLAQCLLKLL